LITGVGRRRGIGASIAAGLGTNGWNLVLSYRHPYDDRIGHERGADDPERSEGLRSVTVVDPLRDARKWVAGRRHRETRSGA
jgi:NAD(P)-dependent dehydrogenase (short-subunit alcohol dehydrogenase family)